MTTMLLSENFPPATGGSARWLWEIYSRMPKCDTRIVAGTCDEAEAFDRTHDLNVHRMPLTFDDWGLLSITGWRDYTRAERELNHLVFRGNVHTIHCGRLLPEGYLALRMKKRHGVPYLCYVHGEELNTASTSRQLTWMTARVLQYAGTIIANSHNTADLLKQQWNVPDERLCVLNPGVDTRRFCPALRSDSVRQALGWGDRPVVLTVGRLQKRKGHDQMLRALPQMTSALPNVLYAIAGDGPEQQVLKGLTNELEITQHVQWMGRISDEQLIAAYQQCDLFALPNREIAGDFEGFGMVLLEAQSCGKPVLAGASGGTRETMIENETGCLVDIDSHVQLADKVSEMLSDPQRLNVMGTSARRWVMDRFDWESLSVQAQEVFKQRRIALRAAA